ncbi:MAG: hypothetical protein ACTSU0_10395, partial [Alphaproteobacteria bacterium]
MGKRLLSAVLPRLGGALTTLVFAIALFGPAHAAGPFSNIIGLWGGSGTVIYASGAKERLSCRAQYVQNDDNNLQQALKCASASYTFQINAYFDHAGGTLTGRWEELVLNVSGTVTGTARKGLINGSLHGPGFVARLRVTTSGSRQRVRISTPDQEIR